MFGLLTVPLPRGIPEHLVLLCLDHGPGRSNAIKRATLQLENIRVCTLVHLVRNAAQARANHSNAMDFSQFASDFEKESWALYAVGVTTIILRL